MTPVSRLLLLVFCGLVCAPPASAQLSLPCLDADHCLSQAFDARERGDEQAALALFEASLEADPQRLRARAERALSLLRLERPQESAAEIESLLALELPENVRRNLERLLEAARDPAPPARRLRLGARLSLGHDDNVARFTDSDRDLGGVLGSQDTGNPRSDGYAEGAALLRWRSGSRAGFALRVETDLLLRRYHEQRDFDLGDLRLRLGPEWRPDDRNIVQLTPSLRRIRRSGETLLDDRLLELAWTRLWSRAVVRLGAERGDREYADPGLRVLDTRQRGYSARLQWALDAQRQWWLGLDLGRREETADLPAQSRTLRRGGIELRWQGVRDELSLVGDRSRYRYGDIAGAIGVLSFDALPKGALLDLGGGSGDDSLPGLRLDYRGAELRWRRELTPQWALLVRARRLIAELGGPDNKVDRNSIDVGLEWTY